MTDEETVHQILLNITGRHASTGTIFRKLPREWKWNVLPFGLYEGVDYKEITVSIATRARERMHHALAKLKAKGMAENPSRGYWQLV